MIYFAVLNYGVSNKITNQVNYSIFTITGVGYSLMIIKCFRVVFPTPKLQNGLLYNFTQISTYVNQKIKHHTHVKKVEPTSEFLFGIYL